MTPESSAYTLRIGQQEELAHAVAIDDAAGLLFTQAGLHVELPVEHPFVVGERTRWARALAAGELWFACKDDHPIGFAALGRVGELAYLEQLAVRPDHARHGLGTRLLEHACAHSRARGDGEIWLTTYAHLAWNGPYYARIGFVTVPEAECSLALQAVLAAQRAVLPEPGSRVAMRRSLA